MGNMRISGITTGMDTDTIVKELMKAERARVEKFGQNKQGIQWRQEAYNSINKSFANFILDMTKEFGLKTKSYGSMLSKPTNQTWVKSAVSSNTAVAEVSGSANAANGNYAINVQRLATGWDAASSGGISTGDKANVKSQFGLVDGDHINFTITTNKGTVTIDKADLANTSIQSIVTEINKANIGVNASYDIATDRFFIQTKDAGSNSTIKIEDNSTINGGVGFIAGSSSKLQLQYKDTMGGQQDVLSWDALTPTDYKGQNALLDIGAAVGIEQQTNQFSVNGVNYSLKSIGNTNVSVSTDVDGILNKVKAFVDKYNDLVEKLHKQLAEERYRKFSPLTNEQKEAMSEDDIKNWEEKAKSGLIRNDATVSKALQTMRSGIYEKVVDTNGNPIGVNDELFDIGITTGDYRNKGKLEINEDRLRAAIMNDADGVLELFFKESSITKADSELTAAERTQKRAESGILNRLFDDVVSGMKDVINKSGTGSNADLYRSVKSNIMLDFITNMGSTSLLEKDIRNIDGQIGREEDRLTKRENHYWTKFTAMEKAIQKMNSQSSWIAQQMGGM